MNNRHALNGSAHPYTLDRNRFAKICSQLDSDHPKAREVAAAKASAMLAAADLTWSDIIFGGTSEPEPRMADMYGVKASALLPLIAAKKKKLTEWDKEFIRCLSRQGKKLALSRKQWARVIVLAMTCGAILDLAKTMGVAVEARH
jgi:hypothetical protein